MDEQRGHDSSKQLGAARLIGKLFGKEKDKRDNKADDIAAFLHHPSDKLYMTGSDPNLNAPPKLAKLDTLSARRWPTASDVIYSRDSNRSRSATSVFPRPNKNKKGLMVRFADVKPEIIGEGGDEAEAPPVHISASRKRAQTYPQASSSQLQPSYQPAAHNDGPVGHERLNLPVRPQPGSRMPSGQSSLTGPSTTAPSAASRKDGGPNSYKAPPNTASDTNYGSLVARMQKQMEISEGQALIADHRASQIGNNSLDLLSSHLADPHNGHLKTIETDIRSGLPSPGHFAGNSAPGAVPTDRPRRDTSASQSDTPLISPATGVNHAVLPVSNEIMDDFSTRVRHYYKLFHLSAESVMPLSSSSFESLLRAASWWFLRGRTAIEHVVKRRASNSEGLDVLQSQGIADLAKCLWILDEVLPQRSQIGSRSPEELYALEKTSRANGEEDFATLLGLHRALYANLRKLVASMEKNNVMPPQAKDAILTQGLNTAIWVPYPWSEPQMQNLFSGVDSSSILTSGGPESITLSDALPLGDTNDSFVYNRIHVGVFLNRDGNDPQGYRLPCILSLQRERTENVISIVISTQDGVLAVRIQSKQGHNPSWHDVKWDIRRDFMDVNLRQGFKARIVFPPGDIASLYNMYEYTSMVQRNFRARDDEGLIMETTVRSVEYMPKDPLNRAFPKGEVLHCKVRVFEKVIVESSRTGSHTRHRGLRIALITGPNTRSLCGLSHDLPTNRPIRFEYMRLDYGSSLFLYLDDVSPVTLALTFETNQDRRLFHNCLIGEQRPNESTIAVLPLKKFSVTGASDADVASTRTILDSFQWQTLHVIIHNSGTDLSPRAVQTAPHYRIIAESQNNDRVTDRLIISPGSLKLRLSTRPGSPSLSILRPPQHDLTISCPESKTPPDTRHGLSQLLGLTCKLPTIRTYHFGTLADLHEFQRALTGCRVLFDGTAAAFSIARRRSVVPLHKKWEAANARIQVLQNDGASQIAAFFEGFAHGECMNFGIRAVDAFETVAKNGRFGVRLADAKFALPRTNGEGDVGKGEAGGGRGAREAAFVCTELLEYAAERDDIVISFDSEDERDRFAKALPSETKSISRFGSMKR